MVNEMSERDCERCKKYFDTDECIVLNMVKIVRGKGVKNGN